MEHVDVVEQRVAITLPNEILADYVGTYEAPSGVNLIVTLEDNQLMVEAPGFGPVQLFAESETHFFRGSGYNVFEFVRGDDGIVTQVILHMVSNDMTLQRKSNDR